MKVRNAGRRCLLLLAWATWQLPSLQAQQQESLAALKSKLAAATADNPPDLSKADLS
jgi:hypothetical protein